MVHQLDVQSFVIGRSKEADFTFSNEEVSRKHLMVFIKDNQIFLKDLGSKNGTFVNGKKIPANQEYMYVEGNPITLGKSRAIFRINAERNEPEREITQPMGVPLEEMGDDTDISHEIVPQDRTDPSAPSLPQEKTDPISQGLIKSDTGSSTDVIPSDNTDVLETPVDDSGSITEEGKGSPFHEHNMKVEKNEDFHEPGQVYDLEDSMDPENSGLSEILGKEKKKTADVVTDRLRDKDVFEANPFRPRNEVSEVAVVPEGLPEEEDDDLSLDMTKPLKDRQKQRQQQQQPQQRQRSVPNPPRQKEDEGSSDSAERKNPFLQDEGTYNRRPSQTPFPEMPRTPAGRGGTGIRRINPKSKRGGFKSPSELMVEVVREVASAIDKQFINIPEDKRARKKGEKILEEVHRLSVELRQKGYEKHDKIIQKAVDKAHFILEEAEKDREKLLESGRKKILSIERRKLEEAEVDATRTLEDARDRAEQLEAEASRRADQLTRETQMRVDKMEAQSSAHAMKMKNEAADELATAKTKAAEIIADAEGHSAEVLHRLEAAKKAIEDELSFLNNKKSSVEAEIESLNSTIKSLDQQRTEARQATTEAIEQQQAEEARLEYEKQRIIKEIEKAEDAVRGRHEDVERQFAEYQLKQDEMEMKLSAEEELFASKKQAVQKEFYKYKSGLEEKLAAEEARFQASVSQLNQQLAKNRERLDGEWKGHQNDHKRKMEELEQAFQREEANFELRLEKRRNAFENDAQALQVNYDTKKKRFQERLSQEEKSVNARIKELSEKLSQTQKEYRDKLAAEEKDYSQRCNELVTSLEKQKKDTEDQIKYEKDRFRQTVNELQERIQAKTEEHDKINEQLIDISHEIQQRKSDNQTILDKLDRAEGDFARLTGENEVLKADNESILREISELRSRKGKVEKAIDDLEITHQKEVENLATMKAETLEYVRNEKLSAQAEVERLIRDAQQSKEDLLAHANAEKDHMVQKAQEQADEILRHAQERYEEMQAEGDKLRAEAESYSQNLSDQVESWKKEQEEEVHQWRAEQEKQVNDHKATVESEVAEFKQRVESEVAEKQNNLEDEIQKRLKGSKRELEMELADIRVKREKELEQSLADIRAGHDEKLQDKAEVIARAMDQKMVSKIRPHLKSSETNDLMDELSVDLQKTILHILDPSKEYADEDLRRVIGINTANMVKDANFRKKAIAAAAVIFVVATSGIWWDRFKTHTAEMASKQKQELDAKVQEVEEKRKNKPKFEPELTNDFLPTYSDRVLYTEDYVKNELAKDYRQEWILKLNDFFVNDLGLSENVIVTFIAKESNLLKDLQGMREGINPQFVKESREDMLKLEKRFTDEVRRVLKSKKNYKKFQSFKKKYYEKAYK